MDRFNKLLVGVALAVGLLCVGFATIGTADENTVITLGGDPVLFDGDPWYEYSVIPYFPELNTEGSELTVECWVNPSTLVTKNGTKMVLVGREWTFPYALWVDPDGTAVFVANPAFSGPNRVTTLPGAIQVGVWTHVAGTYSKTSGEMKIYVNGILVGTNPVGSYDLYYAYDIAGTPVSTNLVIGCQTWQWVPPFDLFLGLIDEIRISNVARDPDEFLTRDGEYAQGYDDGYASGQADLLDILPPGIRKNVEAGRGFAK